MQRFTHPLVAFSRPAEAGAGIARTILGLALAAALIFVFAALARIGARAVLYGPEHEGGVGAMLAADAMKQTRLLQNNPRAMTEADALAIYEAAL